MSDKDDIKALEELAGAIARLEEKLSTISSTPPANIEIVKKHSALKADVSAIIRELDGVIEGARRG